jgi:Protein of unknown function (DUF3575)
MIKLHKILALALIIGCVVNSSAQVDLKIGPLGPVFGTVNLRSEFGLSDNFGLEATVGAGWNTLTINDEPELRNRVLRLGLNGRYYFNPSELGQDKFYLGMYSRYSRGSAKTTDVDIDDVYNTDRFSVGFLTGIKFFARGDRFLFDFNLGIGRAFVYRFDAVDGSEPIDLSGVPLVNLDIPLSIMIGYRFGGKK